MNKENEIARAHTRLNNLEGEVAVIRGMKDPKNTQGRLETMTQLYEDQSKVIGNLTARVKVLEDAIKGNEENEKKGD